MTDQLAVERLKLKQLRVQARADKQARQDAQLDRLMDLVTQPAVLRVGLVAGIIAFSTWATRSEKNVGPVLSALALAGPGIGIPIIAADAGITDWKALAAISATGLSYTGLSMLKGWGDSGQGFNLGFGSWETALLGPGVGTLVDMVT